MEIQSVTYRPFKPVLYWSGGGSPAHLDVLYRFDNLGRFMDVLADVEVESSIYRYVRIYRTKPDLVYFQETPDGVEVGFPGGENADRHVYFRKSPDGTDMISCVTPSYVASSMVFRSRDSLLRYFGGTLFDGFPERLERFELRLTCAGI